MAFKTFMADDFMEHFLPSEPPKKQKLGDESKQPESKQPEEPKPPLILTPEEFFQVMNRLIQISVREEWKGPKRAQMVLIQEAIRNGDKGRVKRISKMMLLNISDENVRPLLEQIAFGEFDFLRPEKPKSDMQNISKKTSQITLDCETRSACSKGRAKRSRDLEEGDFVRVMLSEEAMAMISRKTHGEGDFRKEIKKVKAKLEKDGDLWYVTSGLCTGDTYYSFHQENGTGDGDRKNEWSSNKRWANLEKQQVEDLSREDETLFAKAVRKMEEFGENAFNDTDQNLAALGRIKELRLAAYSEVSTKAINAFKKSCGEVY
jgi:hypothetical protein